MNPLRRGYRWWVLRSHPVPDRAWAGCVARLNVLDGLGHDELARIRAWATLFLRAKAINGVRGLVVADEMRLCIATEACLPILNLDPDLYQGWHEVILYPDTFVVDHDEADAAGVIHQRRRPLAGESWQYGPVILSWADASPDSPTRRRGSNVVIHELAHKLDMLNGSPNGMPPLHRDMSVTAWTRDMETGFDQLRQRLALRVPPGLDPYAAEGPGEFFAVASEHFFEMPRGLQEHYPGVYAQLARYYRQDPASRR